MDGTDSMDIDSLPRIDAPMAEASNHIDLKTNHTNDDLILNARKSHEASTRYATDLERLLTTVAKLQTWLRNPPVQPSQLVITKFFRPMAVKILEIQDLYPHYTALRARNNQDLVALEALDSTTATEVVFDTVATSLRHLNETSCFAISPLVDALRALHTLVRSGKSGLGLNRGVPKNVATELDRMRFHSEIVEGWTIAFENFWVAGGGAVFDLERGTWKA